jgi:transposase
MKVPTKFITDLSADQINQLIENHQNHPGFRVRNRSHAVLLSHQGYSIDEIARICRVDRDTVSHWLDLWQEKKFTGLMDEARSGRPKTLTDEEEDEALEIALENPRFPARQITEIAAETGKQISDFQLKKLLKKRLHLETDQARIVETGK